MNGPEHYAKGEQLLALANSDVSQNIEFSTGERKADLIAAAQAHFTAALVAVHAESSVSTQCHDQGKPLVRRPTRGDDVDPGLLGSPWGRVLYPLEQQT